MHVKIGRVQRRTFPIEQNAGDSAIDTGYLPIVGNFDVAQRQGAKVDNSRIGSDGACYLLLRFATLNDQTGKNDAGTTVRIPRNTDGGIGAIRLQRDAVLTDHAVDVDAAGDF